MAAYDIKALQDDVTQIIFDKNIMAAHEYLSEIFAYEYAEVTHTDEELNQILAVTGTILDIGLKYPQSAEEVYSAVDMLDWWNDNMPDPDDWQQAMPLLQQTFSTIEQLKTLGNNPKYTESFIKNASYLTAAKILWQCGDYTPCLLSESDHAELKREDKAMPDITQAQRNEQVENEVLIRDLTYTHALEMMEIAETRLYGSASAIVASRAHAAYEMHDADHHQSAKIRGIRDRYMAQCAKEGCPKDLHDAMEIVLSHLNREPREANLLHAEKSIIALVDGATALKHRNDPVCLAVAMQGLKELTLPENRMVFIAGNAKDRLDTYVERHNVLKEIADQFLEYKNEPAHYVEIDNKNKHKGPEQV